MVKNLNHKLKHYNKKNKIGNREQKGIKTMEEYKRQLAEYKNGTYMQPQTGTKPLNGTIDDDTNVC